MGIILEPCALAYPVSYLFTFKLTFRNNKLFLALYILNTTLTAFTACQGCRKTAKGEGDFCNLHWEGEGRMGRGSEDEIGLWPTYSVWILWLVHRKMKYGEIHIRQKTDNTWHLVFLWNLGTSSLIWQGIISRPNVMVAAELGSGSGNCLCPIATFLAACTGFCPCSVCCAIWDPDSILSTCTPDPSSFPRQTETTPTCWSPLSFQPGSAAGSLQYLLVSVTPALYPVATTPECSSDVMISLRVLTWGMGQSLLWSWEQQQLPVLQGLVCGQSRGTWEGLVCAGSF